MNKLDIYDFDGTIYNGDSSIDFYMYTLKKKKSIAKYLPKLFLHLILNKIGKESTKEFKEAFFSFLKEIENLNEIVKEFWIENKYKVNNFFLENMNCNKKTYVISASPEFLLKPYLSKYKNIKLIATKVENNGKIVGENCKGKQKLELLYKKEKDVSIENIYSDSIEDMPLVEKAENSFYVHNGKVEKWNINKVKDDLNNKRSKLLFFIFFIIYMIIGVQLTYNYDFSNNNNLMFSADTSRVINDMTSIFGNHYRLSVHPLFVMITQPLYFIISGITQDKNLALVFISAFVSAMSVAIFYKIVALISNNKKASTLVSLCYGLAFSSLVFTASIEVYNIATLMMLLLWYFIVKKLNGEWKKSDFIILVTFGITNLAITITNFIIFLIGCLVLLLAKKLKLKKIVLANLIVMAMFIGLSCFQHIVWQNTPVALKVRNLQSETEFSDFDISPQKIKNVTRDCIYNSILSSDLKMSVLFEGFGGKKIQFQEMGLTNKVVITIFLSIGVILFVKNFRKNLMFNVGLILTLIYNLLLHTLYGNTAPFLYSMHFTYLIFLIFGINCLSEKNKHIKNGVNIILGILLIFEIIINCKGFLQVLNIVKDNLNGNFYISNFGIIKTIIITLIVITTLLMTFKAFCVFVRKFKNEKDIKYLIYTFVAIIVFESVFVLLQTVPKYKEIFEIPIAKTTCEIKTEEVNEKNTFIS